MYHGKQLMDRSDNAATTTDSTAMCHRLRTRAAAVITTKSESLSDNSIRIISPARTGGPTRKKPDEIEERHRLENGRRMAALAEEADNVEEREHYTRLRDAWITL